MCQADKAQPTDGLIAKMRDIEFGLLRAESI
jgi:hypothetical protein